MHLVLCFTEVYLNSIRIFYAIRQRIPFIQPQMLFNFALFHAILTGIFGKVFHQFVNSSRVTLFTRKIRSQPAFKSHCFYHRNIGIGGIGLGNDDQRPQDKRAQTGTKQVVWFIRRLNDPDNVRFKESMQDRHRTV